MHLSVMTVSQIPPITERVSIQFDGQVNLFIGPNSTGKSTVLRLIEHIHSLNGVSEIDYVPAPFSEFPVGVLDDDETQIPHSWLIPTTDWPGSFNKPEWQEVPLLYIPATRVGLPQTLMGDLSKVTPLPHIEHSPWDDLLFYTARGIFYGHLVDSTIELAKGEIVNDNSSASQLMQAVQIGFSCAKMICPEVITGNSPHPLTEFYSRSGDRTETSVHNGMGIVTNDKVLGPPLYAGLLSSGTQGTLLWIYALALKIAYHYKWQPGWEKKPAILLIDEIENHLHPTWQRRVIPALLEHFPGLQILATTHSPFVVAGLKAGQVHLLKRGEDGVVTAETNPQDIIGWTMDEILRTMMGVDEPTDQLTVDRANRLRELRGKEALSPDEESELEILRRQVNEHFLAKSGPLEAQRERYADLMQRFLFSRESDLTQDGV